MPVDQGPIVMTSSNPNYISKALSPNVITVGVRIPTYEFWGTHIRWNHRNANLGLTAPKEKYTVILFLVEVLHSAHPSLKL